MDPNTTQQAVFQYQLITTVASIAALGASITAMIRTFRRNPPLSETILEKFATKSDMKELEAKVEKFASKEDVRELKSELEKHRSDMNAQLRSGDKCFKDLERVIGKLEVLFEMCPYMCGRKPQ
jgi:biopolymer transport protein ExbB/TolQ